MLELKYPLFDGQKVWNGAAVTVENGIITSVTACDPAECGDSFLMPGLIDAHTHMGTQAQAAAMLKSGITATCDVSASKALVESSKQLEIVSSAGMAMGMVLNSKGFVERAADNGARYIKVLLFNPLSIGKPALRGIAKAAHEKGLTPIEVLTAATSRNADAFGLNAGRVTPGQPATMILVDGRPDRKISDSTQIVQIWVDGKSIL